MYTAFQLINTAFFTKLFPGVTITPALEEKIKKIYFFGLEFSKGFKVQKGFIFKKLRENDIEIPEKNAPNISLFIPDDQAVAVGPLGFI